MARLLRVLYVFTVVFSVRANDELSDFEFSDSDEVMIAQESRQYQTVVKPPVFISKPTGVTNSHRPQYNLDSFEDRSDNLQEETTTKRSLVKNYKSSNNIRSKESMVKDAVLRAMDRKDHVGKFAQVLPIIRAISGNQRVALASLVANQVSTPPGRAPLNLAQVRSMFGNDSNTSELMLPILLDMANLIRRAVRPGKEPREVQLPYQPQAQFLRRSFVEDTESSDEIVDVEVEPTTTTKAPNNRDTLRLRYTNRKQFDVKNNDTSLNNEVNAIKNKRNTTRFLWTTTTEASTTPLPASTSSLFKSRAANLSSVADNSTLDLTAESTNVTISQDLPVAEKLRALGSSRFVDRKGAQLRRGIYTPSQPKPSPVSPMSRRTTAEPSLTSMTRRRPVPSRKLPSSTVADPNNCELFTNSLCLQSEDYPAEAIVQSIRRNKAAAAALLADYRDPEEGAVDGVTAAQEAKYNEQHYLVSNRRGDTANRDFASAGEAGFMCPSTVKYARPQRARATSGQWKYIVNTGEHTQTLRLEKCLKPKESCTYLTDNFKSKCVQVYNYHRLLTWDQQNGLHMDIFKVPTCCSCHIEGYSVSFPPLGQRIHETSSEHFPGEDLSAEQGNHALEDVQPTIQRPTFKSPPFTRNKPLESFPPFTDNQNLISGSPFSKHIDSDDSLSPSNPVDSFGNTYFPDTFNQASSIRNVKRPSPSRNPTKSNLDSLPSYLEPPNPDATSSFNFVKDTTKYKLPGSQFKRTVRPSRRPIRKKLSSGPEDLVSSGTSAIEFSPTSSPTSKDDTIEDDYDEAETVHAISPPKFRATIAPKLPALTTEYGEGTIKDISINNENISANGQRVNYNYHPIIDFFDEEKDPGMSPIDREDIEPSYIKAAESEWKPINVPPPTNGKVTFISSQR